MTDYSVATASSPHTPATTTTNSVDLDHGDHSELQSDTSELARRNSRKRRSLNISLDFNWNEKPLNISPRSKDSFKDLRRTHSQRQDRLSLDLDMEQYHSAKMRKAVNSPTGSSGNDIKRSSFQLQNDAIRQQLLELARTENARLSEQPKLEPDLVQDLGIPLGITTGNTYAGSETNSLPFSPPSRPLSSASFTSPNLSFSPSHSRVFSLLSNASSSTTNTSPGMASSTLTQISIERGSTPVAGNLKIGSKNNKKSARSVNACHSANSGSGSSSGGENAMFVMSLEDLAKLQQAAEAISIFKSVRDVDGAVSGPTRPGNIEGEALSWQMAGDILRLGTFTTKDDNKSLLVPAPSSSSADLAKFMWSTLSNPENIKDAFSHSHWIPPREVVNSLRFTIPAPAGLYRLLVKCGWFTMSISVLFVQMLLLGLMVCVYVVGDMVLIPGKWVVKATVSLGKRATANCKKGKISDKEMVKKIKKKRAKNQV